MTNNCYSISQSRPPVEGYLALRTAVGWRNLSAKTAASALDGSLLCVCVTRGGGDACVGLMASQGTVGFYERFDFSERPEGAPGMQKLPAFRRR